MLRHSMRKRSLNGASDVFSRLYDNKIVKKGDSSVVRRAVNPRAAALSIVNIFHEIHSASYFTRVALPIKV